MRDGAPRMDGSAAAEAEAFPARPEAQRPGAFPAPTHRERLRVAIDARKRTDADSGVGSYTLNLVRGVLKEDPDLELILLHNGRWPAEHGESARIEEVYVPFPAESPLTPYILRFFLRGRRFDLFHTPFDLAPRGLRQPLVVTIHDLNWILNPRYNSHNRFMRTAGGFFYRNTIASSMEMATRIIAISNATRNAIIEHAPWHESKIRVIYHGMDRKRIFPLEKEEADRTLAPLIDPAHPFVLTIGQASPYKNHSNAVRGFLKAFRDRPHYRMILVRRPGGRDRELERLLASPQAREQVLLLPSVSAEVLNALYNRARIVLHPSYYEGFGLPLAEAMAAGAPVITSTVSSMPEVVGPAALLVRPADSDAIATALATLDRDEALRARLIAAGHRRLELFDWAQTARLTLDVYREAAHELPEEGARVRRARAAEP